MNLVRKLWRTDKSNTFLRVMPPVQLLPQTLPVTFPQVYTNTFRAMPLPDSTEKPYSKSFNLAAKPFPQVYTHTFRAMPGALQNER